MGIHDKNGQKECEMIQMQQIKNIVKKLKMPQQKLHNIEQKVEEEGQEHLTDFQ